MQIIRFEDIIAWQKAQTLAVLLYTYLKDCRDYSFKDQLLRAALSISNNVAEGFDRNTDKELKYFLFIAKGSAAEVRSMLYLAKRLMYLNEEQFENGFTLANEISKMLTVFISKLNPKTELTKD